MIDDRVPAPQSQDCACLVQCHVPSIFRHSDMMMTTSSRFSRNVPTPPMQPLRGALSLTTFTGLCPSFAAMDLFLYVCWVGGGGLRDETKRRKRKAGINHSLFKFLTHKLNSLRGKSVSSDYFGIPHGHFNKC